MTNVLHSMAKTSVDGFAMWTLSRLKIGINCGVEESFQKSILQPVDHPELS